MDGSARTLSAGERARCQFRANRLSRPPKMQLDTNGFQCFDGPQPGGRDGLRVG